MAAWTEDKKAKVVEAYTSQNPTAENTAELIAKIAEAEGETVNGVRMVLSKAGVYVKIANKTATPSGEAKPKRKSKQESLDELTGLMEDHGVEVEDEVVSKLTGKAAEFFIKAINQVIEG